MSLLRAAGMRLRSIFRREEVERELDEELRFHLDMQTVANVRAGMSPEEARRQAVPSTGLNRPGDGAVRAKPAAYPPPRFSTTLPIQIGR